MENMIEVTGVNLVDLVKGVYALSAPVGLGFIHFQEGELSTEDAEILINPDEDARIRVSLDYVHGRSCKFTVFNEDGKLYIRDTWFDHNESQLNSLLESLMG